MPGAANTQRGSTAVSYACTGSPTLATEVVNALKEAGQPGVVDMSQGLDYSTWMPLSLMYSSHRARHDSLDAPAEGWARAFDDWVGERLQTLDIAALAEYRRRGPHAHLSAPTAEFLDPLFFVLGASMAPGRSRRVIAIRSRRTPGAGLCKKPVAEGGPEGPPYKSPR